MLIEMSRDLAHGGTGWEFTKCLWVPTKKQSGGAWPFWSKMEMVRKGELVLHLRGIQPDASFVGFSTAASDGYRTNVRPPVVGGWAFADEFYRADLTDYNPFPTPISLASVFRSQNDELRRYFMANKALPKSERRNLFFVIQAGRLQCLNGAYLSDLDAELAEIILGPDFTGEDIARPSHVTVATGQRIQKIRARLGQSLFSENIKNVYNQRCCFPGCSVDDPAFLIGAHIARWADRDDLRGRADNGLCFCLMHDKAFEAGYFTLDDTHRVIPLTKCSHSGVFRSIVEPYAGRQISLGAISPCLDAIKEHWRRHGYLQVLPASANPVD